MSGSAELSALLTEIESFPGGFDGTRDLGGVAVPLELSTPIEAFLPADEATAAALR